MHNCKSARQFPAVVLTGPRQSGKTTLLKHLFGAAPGLLPYIKERIDERRSARGQYLLTGSQNLVLAAQVTESLAGRAAMLRLLPLSQREGRWTKHTAPAVGIAYHVCLGGAASEGESDRARGEGMRRRMRSHLRWGTSGFLRARPRQPDVQSITAMRPNRKSGYRYPPFLARNQK